ncbi:MAG: hypothetical protein R2824_13270 [Saprospiraceae bacterium]
MTSGQEHQACYLNITDEKSGAILRAQGFPHWRISQVPWNQITSLLLEIFKQWGLPKAIRTDNGAPFGVPSRDVVPVMSLWLIAWGIQPILNRPRRPEQNAHVESNQGTSQRWAEVKQCQNLQQMQLRLDEAAASSAISIGFDD